MNLLQNQNFWPNTGVPISCYLRMPDQNKMKSLAIYTAKIYYSRIYFPLVSSK